MLHCLSVLYPSNDREHIPAPWVPGGSSPRAVLDRPPSSLLSHWGDEWGGPSAVVPTGAEMIQPPPLFIDHGDILSAES